MNKAMVLGAGGWLGSHLVERLVAAGRDVLCVDIFLGQTVSALPDTEVVEADIRDIPRFASRLGECAVVFNCAGLLHPKTTAEIYAVNRDAPVHLFRACIDAGVPSLVHVSSINAQGANPSLTVFLDETMPLRPFTHYGISKAEGDVAMQAMVRPRSTRLILLRPGVLYGERPSKNLQELIAKLRTGRMPYFSERGFLRTYVDAETVVDALVLGEHHGRSGEAYLIGDEEPLPTLRFYQVLAEQIGVPGKTIRVPVAFAHLCERVAFRAGKADKHLRLPTIVGEFGRNMFCTVEKAKRELGLQPHRSSEPGLRAMVTATATASTSM